MLSELDKSRRKELVTAATTMVKSGVEPTAAREGNLARHQRRQVERALGFRGTKAKRHTMGRDMQKLRKVLLAEEALDAAKDRMEHPIKSRLRRR